MDQRIRYAHALFIGTTTIVEMIVSTPQQGEGGGGGNVWTKRYGPLPGWGWAVILLGVVLIFSYVKKSKSNKSAQQAAANTPGGVDASLVPQFINQEYVNTTPPSAPNVTVNNTVPMPPTTPPLTPPTSTRSPEPSTISSSPGSFTTGLAGGLNEWTSNGKYSLNTIAKSHGMTAQQLIKVSEASENNVALKQYVAGKNFNKPLPAGVHLFFPSANWQLRK